MNRSRRGAARVSITWIIVVVIAFFAALSMVFVFDGEVTDAETRAAAAEAKEAEATAQLDVELSVIRDISEVFGYYDKQQASARTVAATAQEGLASFKDAFGVTEASVADFQAAAGPAVGLYNARAREINDLKQQVAKLTGEIEVNREAQSSLVSEKDSRLSSLQSQLNDANQAAQARQSELESEVARVRSTLSDTESQLTRSRAETDDALRVAREREAEFVTRLINRTKVLEWQKEPERADGQILQTSEQLGLAWINIGKTNRLYAGMRFAIKDGTPGVERIKAYCEVLKVEDSMSEVVISDIRDEFDPPTAGDIIYNPIYDPVGIRNAVLVGRFTGTYNHKDLRALLDGIRINVQDKLDKTTDYLVVGAEIYVDEDGEPLEDPMQPSELAAYKEAEAMGVRIVPIKLITDYFRKTEG
jgi:hypothetical protein